MQRLRHSFTHLPWRWLLAFLLVSTILPFSGHARAQGDVRTFPETGHTLRGAFRYFWETNGNLPIFGYPITEEYNAATTGRLTQYFERARFELIQQNGNYTVELGMLGAEVVGNRIFSKSPPIQNTATKRYIPRTQHIIQYGFKEVWETRGSERIFGWPISDEVNEILEDGNVHIVQYFERARFEFWPAFPPGQRVLISSLGRKLAPSDSPSPQQPQTPPAQPIVSSPPTPYPTAISYPTAVPYPTVVPWPTAPAASAPHSCPNGQPCGNSCIAWNKVCHK